MATCRKRQQIYRPGPRPQPSGAAAPAGADGHQGEVLGTSDSSQEPTFFNWRAGLEAWRRGQMETAAGQFEKVATRKGAIRLEPRRRRLLGGAQPPEDPPAGGGHQVAEGGGRISAHLLRPAGAPGPRASIRPGTGRGAGCRRPPPGRSCADPRRRARPGPDPDRPERPRPKRAAPAAAGQGRQGARRRPSWRSRRRPICRRCAMRLGVQSENRLEPDSRCRALSGADLEAAERLHDRPRAAVRADAAGIRFRSRGDRARRARSA